MEFQTLAALFVAAAINASLPGPCVVAIAGRTLRFGWRGGAGICVGLILGDVVLIAVALGSVAGLIALSPTAFSALKWSGIAALVALAALALRPRSGAGPDSGHLGGGVLAAGLALGVSSPYNLVFYLAVLPRAVEAFVARTDAALQPAQCLAICLAALAGIALGQGATVLVVSHLRRGPGGGRWVDYGTAALMLGIAMIAAFAPVSGPRPPEQLEASIG